VARLGSWSGRTALVTGASSGIGAALARALAARGVRVGLVARRRERLAALAEDLGGGERALALPADVGLPGAGQGAVDAVVRAWGRLDLLVNAAGQAHHVLFKDQDVEDVETLMRVNYLGVVRMVKAALPPMRAAGAGWIVNISSVAGKLGQPDEAAYAASKFAVTGLSESLVYELGPLGIHVLAVFPALVRTEMFTPEVLARMPASFERQFIEPDAFAAAVLRALERGAHELTVPRSVGVAYLVRLLAPRFFRWTTARLRLPALPDLTR
jgi:short-subunit dehydrogenase